MTIPAENLPTSDGASASTAPAIATDALGQDWVCDIDGARLNVIGRHTVGETRYEVRECSADPDHLKHQPI